MGKNKNESGGGGERKKDEPIVSVVLGLDMHCEGCATRIKKSVKSFLGVEVVKGGDGELGKLTVIGKVDPAKLREAVEKKVKKKVELISPAPNKKENNNPNNGNNNPNNDNKENNNNSNNNNNKNDKGQGQKQGEKKGVEVKNAKEPPVTTAVMKLSLHCQGCIQKIKKTVTKTKGYLDLSFDEEKDQITVKGALDMKALAKTLSVKLKKTVEIVPPKKEGEKKEKEKEKENERQNENSGGKGKGGGGGDHLLIHYVQYGYPNPAVFGYGYGYPGEQFHSPSPSMFSDENPNACSIM